MLTKYYTCNGIAVMVYLYRCNGAYCDDRVQCCFNAETAGCFFDIVNQYFTWLFDHASRHAHSWGLSLTIARAKRRIPFSFVVSGSRAVCSLSHEKQSVKRDDSRMQKLVKRCFQPRAGPL